MSVHYKFKSALEYDTVTFDGLHISVKDLKNAIIQQKRIGKSTDFDLQVTNAQTKEVYDDEKALIPKNTSLLIARIPTTSQTKNKQWEGYGGDATPPTKLDEGGPIAKAADLSSLDAPEDDKIKAMMSQSTQDYDPSNYMKIRGANQMGAVPPNYRCYKCHQMGHWIKDCPLSKGPEPIEIKKSTGIPLSFMVPVEGPQVQGAMMTPNGSYAVPVLDHQTYTQKQTVPVPVQEPKPEIPEDLLCSICSDLLTDAVMIPCCGNSFCDECIRSFLLESEDHECPDCHEKDISPGTLIPNRFLRNSVANFKNTTGYVKKLVYKPALKNIEETVEIKDTSQVIQDEDQTTKLSNEEKTVISEADSTEQAKVEDKGSPTTAAEPLKTDLESSEGPPGVSPVESPKMTTITKRTNPPRERSSTSRSHRHRSRESSPRRHRNHRSPQYQDQGRTEERPGTPTVDEPGMSSSNSYPPNDVRSYSSSSMPPMMGVVPQMQGPPPPSMNSNYSSSQPSIGNFPPTNGPPPNFRLPPPGAGIAPYMPPGPYQVPPRPIFDSSRPPMAGPPPMFNTNYPPSSRSHHSREYPVNDRRMRGRTPSGLIDDPLAAFNRMLREKDERERRAKRIQRRSYSRSRSRSRSYSRSPRRLRSRSPRRRQSRSRSRSFSLSRHRFKDNHPSERFREREYERDRDHDHDRDRDRERERERERDRDRDRERERDRERDYGREERCYSREREQHRNRDARDDREREPRDRDRERDNREGRDYNFFESFEDRNSRAKPQWGSGGNLPHRGPPPNEGYYQAPPMEMHPQHPYVPPSNRYPPRDYPPQFKNEPPLPHLLSQPNQLPPHLLPPSQQRRFDDIAPPGVEEPPVPGLEPVQRFEDRYERFGIQKPKEEKSPVREHKFDEKRGERKEGERKRKHEKRSRSPEKSKRSPSVKRKSKSREASPDKRSSSGRRKRRDTSSDRETNRKGYSDEEKTKKSKDKKKKKDKKDSDKKKRKDKKEKHRAKEEKDKDKDKESKEKEKKYKEELFDEVEQEKAETPEKLELPSLSDHVIEEEEEEKPRLYDDDVPLETVAKNDSEVVVPEIGEDEDDNDVVLKAKEPSVEKSPEVHLEERELEEGEEVDDEFEQKEYEDSEKDILEIHTTDIDLKAELEKNEMLAHLPEKSKWEVEEDFMSQTSPRDSGKYDKIDKSGKVTNEVLKRAENAIFAKAINAIRPIEIKKISNDRAKLYSDGKEEGERDDEVEVRNVQVTPDENRSDRKKADLAVPVRLSVKERLGVKIDEMEPSVSKKKSRSISPFSRRTNEASRNYGLGERRVEVVDRKRYDDRSRHRDGRRDRRDVRENRKDDYSRRRDKRDILHRRDDRKTDRKDRSKSKSKHREEEPKKEKRKRTRSRSLSEERKDKRKKKEKKSKKEKVKKHHKEDEDSPLKEGTKTDDQKPKVITDKRKPTIDEASFEPDYDLESESEKEDGNEKPNRKSEEKKSASSSDSSESSSDETSKKKKKHKKHKKRTRRETSSSSSESESDSSEDEKERKKKKHKRKQKKKKKSKHK